MKGLVTGSRGKVGQAACGRLFQLGHEVVGTDLGPPDFDDPVRPQPAYVRADLTEDFAGDPFLAGVAWTWLQEALHAHGAEFTAPSGTVTTVTSESFGSMADEGSTAQLEVRASWTPVPDADGLLDLGTHLLAWCDLLCSTAGLPPPGVVALHG